MFGVPDIFRRCGPAWYLEAEEQRDGLVLSDALQTQLKGIIVYDEEATIGLKAGTANYFRDVELPRLDPVRPLK